MNSEVNVTTTLLNTIKLVEDSTGMIAISTDGYEYDLWRSDGRMRLGFRANNQIDETKRQSITTILKEHGWSVFWYDDGNKEGDETSETDCEYRVPREELWITVSIGRIFSEVKSYLNAR
jgi:hypothetical protein